MARVAAIGLDAFEWRVARDLMAAGRLPHLRALAERSAVFELDNVVAYRSEVAWAQLVTGHTASQLGWHGQIAFDPATYRAWGRGILSDLRPFYADGPRTIAFDVIHTPVASDVNGAQVTAWGAHSPQYWRASSPAGLLTDIDRRFGTNPAFGNDFDIGWYEPDYIDALASASSIGAGRRVDIVEWLAGQHPDWELLLTSMSEIHSVGHHFWHGIDADHPLHEVAPTSDLARDRFTDVCHATDEALGRLLAALPEDTITVVFALHGMHPADDLPSTVVLPELLHRMRFGRRLFRTPDAAAWRAAGYPPVVPERHQPWHGWMRRRFTAGPADHLRHAVSGLPHPLYQAARRLAGKPEATRLGDLHADTPPETDLTAAGLRWEQELDWQPSTWYRRWWSQMPWFVTPSFADGHIRVNLAGREAHGIVEPGDYDRTCAEIQAFVGRCRDPRTGRPAVAEVLHVRADDAFDPDGPDADLLVIWDGAADALEHPEVGVVGPFPHARTGSHSSHGFAMVSGGGVAPGERGRRSAFDLTPTLLSLLQRPAPRSMAGAPIDLAAVTG